MFENKKNRFTWNQGEKFKVLYVWELFPGIMTGYRGVDRESSASAIIIFGAWVCLAHGLNLRREQPNCQRKEYDSHKLILISPEFLIFQ